MTVPLFQENVLRELFEANVFKLLVCEGHITAELIARICTWRHSGFHVYAIKVSLPILNSFHVSLHVHGPEGNWRDLRKMWLKAVASAFPEDRWVYLDLRALRPELIKRKFRPLDPILLQWFFVADAAIIMGGATEGTTNRINSENTAN